MIHALPPPPSRGGSSGVSHQSEQREKCSGKLAQNIFEERERERERELCPIARKLVHGHIFEMSPSTYVVGIYR